MNSIMNSHQQTVQALAPVETQTLFVCRPWGDGIHVLNGHEQWTPILNFARAFPAVYARALVALRAHEGAFIAERVEIP